MMATETLSKRVWGVRLFWAMSVALVLVFATSGCTPNHLLRDKARRAIKADDYARATELIQQALRRDQTDWDAYRVAATIARDRGDLVAAKGHLERAWSLRDNDAETAAIVDELAEVLYRSNDQAALFETLSRASSETGETYDYVRQAKYLAKVGDVDNAELALRKAAEFAEEDDPLAFLAAADFYESIGDKTGMLIAVRKAHAVAPHDPRIANKLRSMGIVPGPTIELQPKPRGN